MQAADLQNAIAANDNTKRLTDVPKFYGNSKDTLTAREFMKRLEQAANIGNWNNKRRCAEFCHLLHSEANGFMSATLEKLEVGEEDWDEHKKLFLKYFDVKGTAKLNFFALHELKQGPSEKVREFWTKIQVQTKRIKETIDPARLDNPHYNDWDQAVMARIRKERTSAATEIIDFFEKMLFIAGLYGEVRLKVMETAPVLAVDALNAAMEAETLIADQKGTLKIPNKIFAVKASPEDEEETQEPEEEDSEEAEALINALNAIRIQKGKAPFKKFPGNYQKSNGNGNGNGSHNGARPKTTNGEPMKCRYCKKTGHMQKECYKRIKENGAMITAQGKQYKANEVTAEKNVGAITASGYPALNSAWAVL